MLRGEFNFIRDNFGLPEIFEDEAYGGLKLLYEDIKSVLKVPIVNFIFRTLAYYDKFLFAAWNEVRTNMLTINIEKAAQSLRYPRISVEVPRINWLEYYSEGAIEEIRRIIFTFNYVNNKLLLIASAWAESLGGRPVRILFRREKPRKRPKFNTVRRKDGGRRKLLYRLLQYAK